MSYLNDVKHRIVARIISSIPSQVRQTMELIEPMVKERFAKIDELGGETWEDAPVRSPVPSKTFVIHEVRKQDDMLMWLMSEAKGVERSLEGLARRLLLVNLAAIQSTSLVRRFTTCRVGALMIHCTDVHRGIIPPSCDPGVSRTTPSGDQSCCSRGRLDESRNG